MILISREQNATSSCKSNTDRVQAMHRAENKTTNQGIYLVNRTTEIRQKKPKKQLTREKQQDEELQEKPQRAT